MTLQTAQERNASKHRVVAEIDIGFANTQWINAGAGIWKVNSDNSYPEVDAELLDGFTAQEFRPIGSVKIDGEPSTKVGTLLELAALDSAWYYADNTLWITCPGFNDPALYAIDIGESYSFSTHSFVPINGPVPIEGRLAAVPSVTMRRDPLFFGRLQYDIGTLQLLNGDGEFDEWGTEVDIYGNAGRVLIGDEDVSYEQIEVGATDELVAFYSFDAGDARDDSGNGYDGTITGATATVGKVGGALSFADGQYVKPPDAVFAVVDEASPLTLSAWAKLSTLTPTDSDATVIDMRYAGAGIAAAIRYVKAAAHWRAIFGPTGSVVTVDGSATTEWVHLALSFDGSSLRFYLNGSIVGTDSSITTAGVIAENVTIGGQGDAPTSRSFEGLIDEVRIYSRALSAEEVKTLYQYPSGYDGGWLSVFAGTMEAVTVDERRATIALADKRKQLTRAITYSCTDLNALSAIEEILLDGYGYTYGATFFDTVAWEAARGEVENVTIDMQEPDSAISVIERIAASVFGVFRYDALERFTFRVIDDDEDTVATIYAIDVLEERRIVYDPTQVVSSVRVGYALNWATNEYTYLVDTSVEDTVFRTYKTYNQRTIDTVLPDLTAAQSFATRVLDYVSTVRGVETVTVSVSFAGLEIGDQIALEVARGTQPMIGWVKAEVIGIEYAQEAPVMRLTVRHGAAIE